MALRKQMEMAAKAGQVLQNEALTSAFDELRTAYIDAWDKSPSRDTEGRERLWQAVQIIGKVRTHLETLVSDGRLAMDALDDIAKPPSAFR